MGAVGNLVIGVPVVYLGVLTAVAASAPSRPGPPPGRPSHRFAILVPAHNEAATIHSLLASLAALDNQDTFTVDVVADNCTDATSAIVRAAGFRAHDRHDPAKPGKGHALNWLLSSLLESDPTWDVVVFLDADTVVEPGFLHALGTRFDLGASAVQGFYGVKDPGTSTATALRYCALACRHHLRPLGRTRLGGSCGLFGNGMAFRRELVADRQWTSHLVEDMELQLQLVHDGILVAYEPEARLAAEMPETLEAAVTQNQRWELGRAQMARAHLPSLARSAMRRGNRRRVAQIDAILDICVPPLSLLAAGVVAVATANLSAALILPSRRTRRDATTSIALAAVLAAHVFTALRLVRAPRSMYVALMGAPKMIVWKLALLAGLTRRQADVDWVRTARNQEMGPR